MCSSPVIRECVEADADGVIQLLPQLWPDLAIDSEAARSSFCEAIRSASHRSLCATVNVSLVGFCSMSTKHSLWCQGLIAHVDEIVVDSKVQSQGIGTRLLNEIEKVARNMGCERIELDSAFHRSHAHRFYERQGYENRAHLFSKVLAEIGAKN